MRLDGALERRMHEVIKTIQAGMPVLRRQHTVLSSRLTGLAVRAGSRAEGLNMSDIQFAWQGENYLLDYRR